MKRGWVVVALASALVAFGIGELEKGNRLYRAGHYAEAVEAYQSALEDGNDSPELQYNLGTALLRLGRLAEAEQHLKSALSSVEPALRQRTLYNLGNRYLTQARAGTVQGDAKTKLLDAAVDDYKQALRISPDDAAAKWNLELALRQKDEQKQQSGGGGNQQKSNGGGGGGSSGGGGSGGSQAGQGNDQGATGQTPMSQSQADRILSAAEQDERQLYRDRVKQGQREVPVARDW